MTEISVADQGQFPQMMAVKSCFIRGSVVRYIVLPAADVDTELLQDSTRLEAKR